MRVLELPEGNVELPGKLLTFFGSENVTFDGQLQHQRIWVSLDDMRVIASLDETPHGKLLHVSLSYLDKDPSWAEIRAVRDAFFPADVDAMMMLPQAQDYVNVHQHAFHIWQTPTEWGV